MLFSSSYKPIQWFFLMSMFLTLGCSTDYGEGVSPIRSDNVEIIEGLTYQVFAKWGDEVSASHYVGFGHSQVVYFPENEDEGKLWIGHDVPNPLFISGYTEDLGIARHKKHIRKELYQVGGSLIRVSATDGEWNLVADSKNMRVTGAQNIPFEWNEPIRGKYASFGTVANAAGGVTPYGTILLCEERFDYFYGDRDYKTGNYNPSKLQWESFLSKPTEHYGWIVEIDPNDKQMKKQIGLGRFAHGAAHALALPDRRVVVYSGDTRSGGMLYKYVSVTPDRIYPGQLYVANMESGVWRPIDYDESVLQNEFENETDMLIHTAEAAKLIGGTSLDKPVGIATDPTSGDLFIALSGHEGHGSILRLRESNDDLESMTFEYETFIEGGEASGFSNPSVIKFDQFGNLWFASDISSSDVGSDVYGIFGNNGLFVVRENQSDVIQIASAPHDASFGDMSFIPNHNQVFVSVNHPGEQSTSKLMTSHWPEGGGAVPKSAMIVLSGDFLDEIKKSL